MSENSSFALNHKMSEMSVLGTMLTSNRVSEQVKNILKPEDFYIPEHRKVYEVMCNILDRNSEISTLSVYNELSSTGNGELFTLEYLSLFLDYQAGDRDITTFARQISEASGTRSLGLFYAQNFKKYQEGNAPSFLDGVSELATVYKQLSTRGVTESSLTDKKLFDAFLDMLDEEFFSYPLLGITSIDNQIMDFYKKETLVFAGRPGMGKALADSHPVLTPEGWVYNRDIKVGSYVIGSDGLPTRVLGVFPQGERDIYKVTFHDGTTSYCDLEHLWLTHNRHESKYGKGPSVKSLAEIMENVHTNDGRKNHKIQLSKAVQQKEVELPVDPYLLGATIGGGDVNCRVQSTDLELISMFPGTPVVTVREDDTLMWSVATGFQEEFRKLGIFGKKTYERNIPTIYLLGSIEQRTALLQGLMDTDGTVDGSSCRFSSSSKELCESLEYLIRSLGGSTKGVKTKESFLNGVQHRDRHEVNFYMPADGVIPFRLTKHLERWKPASRVMFKYISSVEYSHVEHATCIKVEASDSLYVIKDFVVTHNTTALLQSANSQFGLGKNRKVGFISMEMRASKLVTRALAQKLAIDSRVLRKLASTDFTRKEGYVAVLEDISKRLVIDDVGPWNISNIKRKVYNMVYNMNVDIVYIDYLGLIVGDPSSKKGSRQEEISEISRTLKELAGELDIPIVLASQLNRGVENRVSNRPQLSDLRESGAVEQDASIVVFFYPNLVKLNHGKDEQMTNADVDNYLKGALHVPSIIDIAKHRSGPVFPTEVEFQKDFNRFKEVGSGHVTYGKTAFDDSEETIKPPSRKDVFSNLSSLGESDDFA